MSDELLNEIDSVLASGNETKSKLSSYFHNDNEDDFFTSIFKDNVNNQECDSKDQSNTNQISKVKTRSSECINSWLVSESTKSILAKVASNELTPNTVNKSLLARPQLSSDINRYIVDPAFYLLEENYDFNTATELRNIPAINKEFPCQEDIIKLLNDGWIRPVIDLTSHILHNAGFKYTIENLTDYDCKFNPYVSQIWCLRFSLMMKIKLYNILEQELSGFLNMDCPNLYGEFYTDELNRFSGSLIPFSLRMTYAEVPLFSNKHAEAINRLYYLLTIVKRILVNINNGYTADGISSLAEEQKDQCLLIWNKRQMSVYLGLIKAFLFCKDYYSTLDLLNDMVAKEKSSRFKLIEIEKLYQVIGKIYLLIGDISNGSYFFTEACNKMINDEHKRSFCTCLYNGMIMLAKSNYEEAQEQFHKCYQMEKSSLVAINNYAVSCLYTKRVKDAISVMENAIQEGNFNDVLIFNLCILYELQTSQLKNKKLRIVKMLAQFLGDDYSLSSFKFSE